MNDNNELDSKVENNNEVQQVVSSTNTSNTNVNSSGNMANNNAFIQEVTVQADSNAFNRLDESEISPDSVFNKISAVDEKAILKEEREKDNQKKGFPFFVIFVLFLFVGSSFYIDEIVLFVNNYINGQQNTAKNLTIAEVKTALDNSIYLQEFEETNNLDVEIKLDGNKLILDTKNPLDEQNITAITVEFDWEDDVLTAMCDLDNSDNGLLMSKVIIKEIALLQEVDDSKIDKYIDENLYTSTIDKGFELTHSEDGNNIYKIATNIKLLIE